jgi:hypothetical protein
VNRESHAVPSPGEAATPRLTVALTFDHDGIASEVRRSDGPTVVSRGEFGPRVGVGRILELLGREGIASTWFVPGHTVETFQASVAAVVEAGHELACHGWLHEDLASLSADAQRAVLERSLEALTHAQAGIRPVGFRAPYWSLGAETLAIVESLSFAYDSSLMDDDSHLHRVRHGDVHDPAAGVSSLGQEASWSKCPSAGRSTTGPTSSLRPARSARCRRRRRSSRSGSRSSDSPGRRTMVAC